jgi:hypothetical protein
MFLNPTHYGIAEWAKLGSWQFGNPPPLINPRITGNQYSFAPALCYLLSRGPA